MLRFINYYVICFPHVIIMFGKSVYYIQSFALFYLLPTISTYIMVLAGDHKTDHRTISLLIINPNSSKSITDGLNLALTPLTPPGTELTFYTAPNNAPSAISDLTTGIQSANACYDDIITQDLISRHDGFLVCCCEFLRGPGLGTHDWTASN